MSKSPPGSRRDRFVFHTLGDEAGTPKIDLSVRPHHHGAMTDMAEAKWVRIMCDYGADPVWGPDGAMNHLEDLPVTKELRQGLQAWEDEYDAQNPGGISPPFDVAEFSRRGCELAREVKRQLPDWTVIYFDEEASANRSEGAPRETYEYLISL